MKANIGMSLFFIGGLIYAIATSPEKKGTSAAAFFGLVIGLLFDAIIGEKMPTHESPVLAELLSVFFAVVSSWKAKNRAIA
jgi:uncharacterized protein YacL